MQTVAEYKAYFQSLAQEHIVLNGSFVFGDWERYAAINPQDKRLPCLWVETPTVTLLSDDMAEKTDTRLFGYIMVLVRAGGEQTWAEDDDALSDALNICYDIIRRIRRDSDNDQFDWIQSPVQIEPVNLFTTDGDQGWRFPLTIESKGFSRCLDATRWAES